MTMTLTRGAEGMARRAFTVKDVERMISAGIIEADERFELIEGEIVPMSPKFIRHVHVQGELQFAIRSIVNPPLFVGTEGSVFFSSMTFLNLDLVVYKKSEGDRLRQKDVLLSIEVVESSLRRDLGPRAKLVAKNGVRDYWVVNAKTLETTVHRSPTENGYASVVKLSKSDVLTPEAPELAALRLVLDTIL